MTIWLAETIEDRRTVLRIGRNGTELVAEWPGLARLTADRSGSLVRFERVDGADPDIVEKLRAGAVRAMIRHLHGELTLHASGIARNDRAVVFLGDSGTGKSTFAYEASRYDWSLLGDDCVFMDGELAVPTESVSWLIKDGTKTPTSVRNVATKPARLCAIFILSFVDGPVRVARLRGAAAAAPLARSVVRFVMDEPDVHRSDLDRVAQLERVGVHALMRPRGIEHVPTTLRAIEEVVGW